MCEGLRKVAEVLAPRAEFFGIEPEMVGVADHLLEEEARSVHVARARKALDEPERAHVEGALLAH